MKRILFCLFLLMSFSTIYATNYNYTVDCITDSSGNIVESTDEIVSGGTYKIERKTFSNIDDNSDTTFCIGKYVSKILSENTVDITSTIKTETITSSYSKNASVNNLQQGPCKQSGSHNHTGNNFNIPSNVTVTSIGIQYFSSRDYGSGGNAILFGSPNGSDWYQIASGFKYNSTGNGQLWTNINTSYRYLRISHSGDAGIRTVVDHITITGTINSGVQISDASFTVNDRIVKNITVTSSNTSWDTSGIDTSIWDVSTQEGTLTLTAKNQSDINNVTSDQVVAAIKAVKWSSTTAPDPTVKITTLG